VLASRQSNDGGGVKQPTGLGIDSTFGLHSAAARRPLRSLVVAVCLLGFCSLAAGQSPAESHATEWALTTGGAADLPGGARGGQFWAMQLRWGKVLTAAHGPGALRGTLEYAFELVPAMILRQTCTATSTLTFTSLTDFLTGASTTTTLLPHGCTVSQFAVSADPGPASLAINKPTTLYGGGLTPFFWQYNFTSSARVVPYFNLGAGMLFTSQNFPAGTSSFNFTPQGGIGAYWFQKPHRAVSFGVRYHHISNAGITKPNPGHNALYFYGGLSWWR
jgi:lipid A 3-O-deacylase